MNRLHAFTTAMILIVTTLVVLLFAGCAQEKDPVTPANILPSRVATITTPGSTTDLTVLNDTVYIADNTMGIARVALRNQYQLVIPNLEPTNIFGEIVWVGHDPRSNQLLVADRDASTGSRFPKQVYSLLGDSLVSLPGLDVSGPRHMEFFSDPDTVLRINKSDINGDLYNIYTYKYDSDLGAWALTPGGTNYRPNVPSADVQMAVWDKPYAYAAAEEYGFVVLSIPSYDVGPTEYGYTDVPGYALWVEKLDTLCYVATRSRGVSVVSVANPAQPRLLTTIPVPNSESMEKLTISTDKKRLYAMDGNDGIYVLGLSNPAQPVLLGLLPSISPNSMYVHQDMLLVADQSEGLIIYR
ncbi:MAG: hypothetical protein OEM52_06645 [bacterium]|nr:hypothetical protein [bacterium]